MKNYNSKKEDERPTGKKKSKVNKMLKEKKNKRVRETQRQLTIDLLIHEKPRERKMSGLINGQLVFGEGLSCTRFSFPLSFPLLFD
jgi:hypothetical protein